MAIVKHTNLSDSVLKYNGYIYLGEHSLDKMHAEKFFNPKEFAKRFCKDGVEEILYKTRIQQTSSTRLIKIFAKMEINANKHEKEDINSKRTSN